VPISHERRCVFIHVPKTGGTSIETALGLHGPWQDENRRTFFGMMGSPDLLALPRTSAFLQHLSIGEVQELAPEAREYFSFAFVRNPWDRMVSAYHRTDPHLLEQGRQVGIHLSGLSFAEFLSRTERIEHAHLREQAHFICDRSGTVRVDYTGRFETIEQDFRSVCRRLGVDLPLPRLNTSTHRDYRHYYDGETAAFVAKRYRRDIELFGYTF
jgi:hypothetical protein